MNNSPKTKSPCCEKCLVIGDINDIYSHWCGNPSCPCHQASPSLPKMEFRKTNGKYDYSNMDILCTCGHSLGLHIAEAPRVCGNNGTGLVDCDCKQFKPAPPSPSSQKKEENPMSEEQDPLPFHLTFDGIIREMLEWYKDRGIDHGDLVIAEEGIKDACKKEMQLYASAVLEEERGKIKNGIEQERRLTDNCICADDSMHYHCDRSYNEGIDDALAFINRS